LTLKPDTTSGGSHRQNSTPATSPCPPGRNRPGEDQSTDSKISYQLRESPGLKAIPFS
jgi:hypothetical protein